MATKNCKNCAWSVDFGFIYCDVLKGAEVLVRKDPEFKCSRWKEIPTLDSCDDCDGTCECGEEEE